MPVALDAEANAKIASLRRQFVQRMGADATSIQVIFDRIGPQMAADTETAPLRKICHTLCGAAGVFGYPVVAEAASRMTAAFASGERDGARLAPMAQSLVAEIRRAITEA